MCWGFFFWSFGLFVFFPYLNFTGVVSLVALARTSLTTQLAPFKPLPRRDPITSASRHTSIHAVSRLLPLPHCSPANIGPKRRHSAVRCGANDSWRSNSTRQVARAALPNLQLFGSFVFVCYCFYFSRWRSNANSSHDTYTECDFAHAANSERFWARRLVSWLRLKILQNVAFVV